MEYIITRLCWKILKFAMVGSKYWMVSNYGKEFKNY
jgi:hypothetical protein